MRFDLLSFEMKHAQEELLTKKLNNPLILNCCQVSIIWCFIIVCTTKIWPSSPQKLLFSLALSGFLCHNKKIVYIIHCVCVCVVTCVRFLSRVCVCMRAFVNVCAVVHVRMHTLTISYPASLHCPPLYPPLSLGHDDDSGGRGCVVLRVGRGWRCLELRQVLSFTPD